MVEEGDEEMRGRRFPSQVAVLATVVAGMALEAAFLLANYA